MISLMAKSSTASQAQNSVQFTCQNMWSQNRQQSDQTFAMNKCNRWLLSIKQFKYPPRQLFRRGCFFPHAFMPTVTRNNSNTAAIAHLKVRSSKFINFRSQRKFRLGNTLRFRIGEKSILLLHSNPLSLATSLVNPTNETLIDQGIDTHWQLVLRSTTGAAKPRRSSS